MRPPASRRELEGTVAVCRRHVGITMLNPLVIDSLGYFSLGAYVSAESRDTQLNTSRLDRPPGGWITCVKL